MGQLVPSSMLMARNCAPGEAGSFGTRLPILSAPATTASAPSCLSCFSGSIMSGRMLSWSHLSSAGRLPIAKPKFAELCLPLDGPRAACTCNHEGRA